MCQTATQREEHVCNLCTAQGDIWQESQGSCGAGMPGSSIPTEDSSHRTTIQWLIAMDVSSDTKLEHVQTYS